jgi:uncharacterized membrane protein
LSQRHFQPITGQLLIVLEMRVMMMVAMVVAVYDYYNLRLRSIG